MVDDTPRGHDAMLATLDEPLRSHARAVLAADLRPSRVLRDEVYLAPDCEHIEVQVMRERQWTDPDGAVWSDPYRDEGTGRFATEPRVIPITDEHPWWHDGSSILPRFSG